ncbi:hypothetical protein [Duganella sp. HH105]|uniref:hypothetical protein n=1 Tax=Duganella sp. HH105 TaxID=1781067 RepID=UPI000892B227|nr:hypothetical protein [Duganella sp. HH105]OEZ60479.1 hypothetical protein DUGA6_32100 [Duganella sp. HH105]
MQPRLYIATFVYLGSYLPLSLILLVQDYDFDAIGLPLCSIWGGEDTSCSIPFTNAKASIFFTALCATAFLATIFLLKIVKGNHKITIIETKHIPADLINYVFPYVVSFMSLDYKGTGKIVGFLIFLTWMFLVTYKSGQIMLNPLLIVFGWKLYEIKYKFVGGGDVYTGRALANLSLQPNATYKKNYVQDVLIIKNGDI